MQISASIEVKAMDRKNNFISKFFSNPIAAFVAGTVISSIFLVSILPYVESEPDFFITVDYPYVQLNNTTSEIQVFIHDINSKYNEGYEYPIALFLREEGSNSLPQGIKIGSKDQIIDLIDSNNSRMQWNITLNIHSIEGPHLIEILAIGGDGKVRSTHLVIDSNLED